MSVMFDPCILCIVLLVYLFGETICNMLGCDCYFVVECYGCV